MKTIVEILNSKRYDAWFGKTFMRLNGTQLRFVEDYLIHNQHLDKNEFAFRINRLFILSKTEYVNNNVYEYNTLFPVNKKGNHPKVSLAQELMSAVHSEFKK